MDQGRVEKFIVEDVDRLVDFEGVLLGASTSRNAGKSRWYEVAIYRTVGGTYVVSGAGRTIIPGETDRTWVFSTDDPQGIVERLYMQDDDGVWYLPRTSREVLAKAAVADEDFQKAYATQTID